MRTWVTLATVAAVAISAPATAQEAVGDWVGILEVNAEIKLPTVVHIKRDDAGALSGTLDSPTQGAVGIPLADIVVSPGQLAFQVPAVGGSYRGTWDEGAKVWRGEFRQNGTAMPLNLTVPPPPAPLPANWAIPSAGEIAALADARIAPRSGQGLVIGVIEPDGHRIIARGPAGGSSFDGDTLFEIGSISKVFTALILADMVTNGEVSLDDPAAKYLPAGATMPARGGRQITLRDLATHMSGLPRLPDNMPFADPADPYADYTEALMLEFLGRYQLPREIGEKHEYSNFGMGVLGYLLGRAAGTDYETLLRRRITGPLGMADTSITLSPAQQARFAPGYDNYMQPAKPWHLPMLAGAGAIRSTANDMLKFAAAVLDPGSPIAPAMKVALATRRETGNKQTTQALGWLMVSPEPGREVLMHDGGTGGYRSMIALEPAKERAVVTLANSSVEPATNDLATHLLVGSPVAPTPPVPPAPPPVVARTEVTLPPAELDRVVGIYDFGSGVAFAVTREGDGLRAQRQGLVSGPVLPIFAEGPLRFFYKAVDAQIRFIADDSGKVTGAEFTQGGATLPGKRVEP